MTRITYTGRDHDTARHNPTYLEEDIMPINQKGEHPLVSLAIWLLIIAVVALTWVLLP